MGPVYAACLYPELAEIVRKHGYTLAVHGSLARDFDLVAIPWEDVVSDPLTVLAAIENAMALVLESSVPVVKKHGRLSYGFLVKFGDAFIDISFMPRMCDTRTPEGTKVDAMKLFHPSFS